MDLLKRLPNCKVYSTVRQEDDENEWVKARTRGIGGSDIGAICGVSPFTSARQVYLTKTGQYPDSFQPNAKAKERMKWGHKLEAIVADEYVIRNHEEGDGSVKDVVHLHATVHHKDHEWALANIDRLIIFNDGTLGILECKTTGEYNNDEWEQGDILMSYIYQLNWYLWILGLERGAFACLVGGNKFYSYEVFRNDELINDVLIPKAKEFWFDNVLALREPEMMSVDTDFANTIFSDVVKNSEVTFEDDVTDALAQTVFECKAQIKELTATMEEAQNRIKDKLKNTEIGYTKNYIVKWSPRSQQRVDTDKLKTQFPEVYEQCKKQINFRAMYVKGGIS